MNSIILEARGLTKEYKQTIALDHINLQIKKGKIYGFIGQNGAEDYIFKISHWTWHFLQAAHLLYGESQVKKNCRNNANELDV